MASTSANAVYAVLRSLMKAAEGRLVASSPYVRVTLAGGERHKVLAHPSAADAAALAALLSPRRYAACLTCQPSEPAPAECSALDVADVGVLRRSVTGARRLDEKRSPRPLKTSLS